MINRRQMLQLVGTATGASFLPGTVLSKDRKRDTVFRYCLNTSTISGQNPGLPGSIDLAGKAGYDGIELWIRDIREYLNNGGSTSVIRRLLDDHRLTVESAIGFAPWMSADEPTSRAGFIQMEEEMELMAELGCNRIAAPAAGVNTGLDLFKTGEKYRELLDLGRKTGVMPQLEFWGSSPYFYHIGQALMVCAIANDQDARILTDVYHMFRGGTGFDTLMMLKGHMIEIFHMNDYPGDIPREKQTDADRVYPGDGAAPVTEILKLLDKMGGIKVLSLELFNPTYWKEDALQVARTGLDKMKRMVIKAVKTE